MSCHKQSLKILRIVQRSLQPLTVSTLREYCRHYLSATHKEAGLVPQLATIVSASSNGRYRCPGCGNRFDTPTPYRVAPWYRVQAQKLRCPHCQAFLRDRKVLSSPRQSLVLAGVFFLLIVSAFFRLPTAASIAVVSLLVFVWVVELVQWWRANAAVKNEEERYAVEESIGRQ